VSLPRPDTVRRIAVALRIAPETPDAAARWLAGEPPFGPAKVEP